MKGVYRITGESHRGWSRFVDSELGNYDYLLGVDVRTFLLALHCDTYCLRKIDHRHPEVREDLFAWGQWVLQVRVPFSGLGL